jgi:hypothetical protein
LIEEKEDLNLDDIAPIRKIFEGGGDVQSPSYISTAANFNDDVITLPAVINLFYHICFFFIEKLGH